MPRRRLVLLAAVFVDVFNKNKYTLPILQHRGQVLHITIPGIKIGVKSCIPPFLKVHHGVKSYKSLCHSYKNGVFQDLTPIL